MLESTRTSLQMVNNLNDYFDMAVVPDPFLIQAYRDSGVKIPIFYLPLGLYLDNFLKAPLKEYKNSPFVFAYLSSCINRKNQLSLIRAFSIAFKDNPDVLLKINFRGGDESYIKAVITEVEKLQDKRIILTHNCLNNREYLNFFEGIDCYISISKGEGFSIQPREAMTLGIPVIVSDNTAQSTIVQSGLVRAVRSQITEPAFYIFNKCESKSSCNGKVINPIFYLGDVVGSNYGCKVRDIADAMKDVYEHYDDYLVNKERARAWASSYQYDKLTSLYKSMVMPKRVILGDEDIITEEYVMTSSKDLYKKYNDIIKNL
jgi:glycosyltransferase involved in cell wall biosynthesis